MLTFINIIVKKALPWDKMGYYHGKFSKQGADKREKMASNKIKDND